MSYNSDHEKYGDFFDRYSPNKRREPDRDRHHNRKKRKKRRLRPWVKALLCIIALVLVIILISTSVSRCSDQPTDKGTSSVTASSTLSSPAVNAPVQQKAQFPKTATYTKTLGGEIESPYAILVDTSDNTILARRRADDIIYPASMTKAVTLLVAAEHIKDITATFKMTSEIIDPLYKRDLTLAGFGPGEEVRLIDMLYGMTLNSGAEAAVGIATHVAGSEEAFVKLMNDKAKELGLKNTHFTNTSGLHDKNHYTTCTEMAILMNEVIKNDFCREIISTEYYTVPANSYHEELKFHSGMFQKMYGTEPEVATVKGGKTGFTAQSLFCLVSYAETKDGRKIICVTAKGDGKYSPIYDCIKLYKEYTHPKK
ncbi:MAG: D-alanyl-D-alanine carboxypeptidase [Clostridia bacterium]|nr:D-alanyl-D-alanine carboxypeptidase [Clostridia bacterium]